MERFESEPRKDIYLDAMYERACELLDRNTPSPDDFREMYGDEEVDRDIGYVEKMEAKFASRDAKEGLSDSAKKATILEAIVHDQAELSNWLGENAYTTKASRYDDIANGVDDVVEFEEEDGAQHLAVAMDVTFSSAVENKLNKIKTKDLDRGELPNIKYFESESTGERRELREVPRVVIGIGARAMHELMELWMQKDKTALAQHPIQHMILREMELQLRAFGNYAESKGNAGLAARYRQDLEIVERILKEKKSPPAEDFVSDPVFDSIRTYAMFKFRE